MLSQLLRLTGLDQQVERLKVSLETKANDAAVHIKGMVVHFAVVAGLAMAAFTLAIITFLVGLAGIFVWLKPIYGTLPAIGFLAAALLSLTVVFLIIAIVAGQTKSKKIGTTLLAASQPAAVPIVGAASNDSPSTRSPNLNSYETQKTIDAVMSILGRYVVVPKVGIAPVDEVLRILEPRAQDAAKEAINRAAGLIKSADRITVLAVLGAAAAAGWLLVKSAERRAH